MKKAGLVMLVVTPLMLGLSGCVVKVGGNGEGEYSSHYDHSEKEYKNRKKIARLTVDTSINEVRSSLGTADFNESYVKEGEQIQVLFYRTQRVHSDGMTTKDECTPLIFKQGLLDSWGEKALAQL